MSTKKDKIIEKIKKLPYKELNKLIEKAKSYLKKDKTMKKIFKDYKVDINEIDYIPTYFDNLDVSAKTNHGVVILSYKLLVDKNFIKDYSYLVHEYTHWLQQTTGTKPTKGADDGDYLRNPFEQEGFQNQVEYIAEHEGEEEAEDYVDNLLDYHKVKKQDKDELEAVFLEKV